MTTNEMILKTLTTKVTKEPKYKSILEDMGFTISIIGQLNAKLLDRHL